MYPVSEADEHIISKIFIGYWLIIEKLPCASCWFLVKNVVVVYCGYCRRCSKAICEEWNLFYEAV